MMTNNGNLLSKSLVGTVLCLSLLGCASSGGFGERGSDSNVVRTTTVDSGDAASDEIKIGNGCYIGPFSTIERALKFIN